MPLGVAEVRDARVHSVAWLLGVPFAGDGVGPRAAERGPELPRA